MPTPDEPDPKDLPTSNFHRFKCWLTGVDPVLLADCPARDHDSVNAIFLLQMGAWLWQAMIFSVVAHMMLAKPGEVRPELIVIAALLASMIALIDSFMIIRSSWYLHGLEELRRCGLMLPGALAIKLKNAAFLAFRIMLSIVLVQLVAGFVGILICGKDVDHGVDTDFHNQNAPVFVAAEKRYDRDTTAKQDERAKLAASIAQADNDASTLRRGAATPPPPDEEVQELRKRLMRLEKEKRSADAAVTRARLAARRGGDEASARLQAALTRAAPITQAMFATRQRLQDSEARVERAADRQNNLVDTRLSQTAADRAHQAERLAALDAEIEQRASNREAAIRAAVERDPALEPRNDGLLAQVHILARLAEDRHNLFILLLIDAAFFAIELAAVLAKVTTFIPATYATELAKTEYLRAWETSREMAARINTTGIAPPTAPSLSEEDALAEDGEVDPPLVPAADEAGSTSDLDASLRQAARAAHTRAAKKSLAARQTRPKPDLVPIRTPRRGAPGAGRRGQDA